MYFFKTMLYFQKKIKNSRGSLIVWPTASYVKVRSGFESELAPVSFTEIMCKR